ncbi:MAG TPA: TPM domain-containing protein [Draconibacterium sp.]|nr:TPM domain-containing protein [Draconibacterium sp.]
MKRILTIIPAFSLLTTISFAQIPERPNPPRLVNDFANILSDAEQTQLENELVQFAQTTSTQIVVVTVSDLEGNDPGNYAFQIGEKWGVGQKDKDNGIVVLVKPKQGNSKGQVFVATGYGLEGILPDAVVNSTVVDFEMIPRFKENDYFGGISNGVKVIMEITRGEYTAEQYQQKVGQNKEGGFIPAVIIFILVFVFMMRGRRNRFYSPGKSLPFWLAMGMMSGSNRSGGSFGNFSSGSGGFGGFGGFGGGSFGGGGAGGSW